jgi:hypothetical protein
MAVIIVSRHPATVAFIREAAKLPADTPAYAEVTAGHVRKNVVYGNLPLHLAAMASQVVAVEFDGIPPRGQEYTAADMTAAGAKLRRYTVAAVTDGRAAITGVPANPLRAPAVALCDALARDFGDCGASMSIELRAALEQLQSALHPNP